MVSRTVGCTRKQIQTRANTPLPIPADFIKVVETLAAPKQTEVVSVTEMVSLTRYNGKMKGNLRNNISMQMNTYSK
jgi:hypothetical protein